MILAILQARYSSTRLPGKVLRPILGKTFLELQLERLKRSKKIDNLVVATSTGSSDHRIQQLCEHLKIECFRGSLNNVLDRYYQAAKKYKPSHIVRLTGDCPLTDPIVIDQCIEFYLKGNYDYVSNTVKPSFPDGLDVEIFKYSVLVKTWKSAILPSEKEHVTPFILKNPLQFKIGSFRQLKDYSDYRWTLDEPEDLELITQIFESLYPSKPNFTTEDIFQLLEKKPKLMNINNKFIRNQNFHKSLLEDEEL